MLVAYSGGVDSHVLLHASQRALLESHQKLSIRAVHINHQLQPKSESWKLHCAAICSRLSVPFTGIDVNASAELGQSPQAAARDARYAAFKNEMQSGDVLLTAHHRNDQAETVLLQLLRGSGVAGLAAMPHCRQLGEGIVLRPFLELPQHTLCAYAATHALEWVEDPSNQSDRYARNYLRNSLWPLIESHWPAAATVLARAAKNNAEASALNGVLAAIDSENVVDEANGSVDLSALANLELLRRKNVLRYWLKNISGRFPSQHIMQSILDTVIDARDDAQPLVEFAPFEIRRYRGSLHAVIPGRRLPSDWSVEWRNTRRALEIPELGLTLPVSIITGLASPELCGKRVEVRLRRGGESIVLPGRPRKSLKALMQENAIAPWRRDNLPLIYLNGTLVAVHGISNVYFQHGCMNKNI